jgi:hypothetical protein
VRAAAAEGDVVVGERVMSKVSGFSNGRLVPVGRGVPEDDLVALLICLPVSSRSVVAVRRKCMTGVT